MFKVNIMTFEQLPTEKTNTITIRVRVVFEHKQKNEIRAKSQRKSERWNINLEH